MWATGWPDDGPVHCPVPIAAVAAGLHGAIAAVAALYSRMKGRNPAPIGISLLDALAFCQEYTFMHAANLGTAQQRNGGRHPSGTPSQIFATKSGYLAVMAPSDREFDRLCAALGALSLSADARFETMIDRLINRDALTHELERLLAHDTAENWFAALSEAGIACAPVRRLADVPSDILAVERGLFSVRHANDASQTVCVAVPDGAKARTGRELSEPRLATNVSWLPRAEPQPPTSSSPSGGPLAGVSVVDLTRYLAGPFATTLLADLGALVLKFEPEGGDPARGFGPIVHGTSGYFASINRGKTCHRINLRSTGGVEQLREALRSADLLIENFRPGTLAQIGIPGEEPGIRTQTVSISGFGQHGSLSQKAAYDMTIQAFCGIMTQTGSADRPTRLGFSLGDIAAGLFAALSAVVRLVGAERGLAGGQADIAMADALYAVMESLLIAQASGVIDPKPSGAHHVDAVPQGAFPCCDGYVYIAAASDFDFVDLWEALHLGFRLQSTDFGTLEKRRTRRSELVAAITAETERYRREDLLRLLSGAGIRAAPVLSVTECLESTYFRDAGLIVAHPEFPDFRVVRTPFVDLSNPPISCGPRIENIIEENVR
jgi:CoA:oxalate CoA-transferase